MSKFSKVHDLINFRLDVSKLTTLKELIAQIPYEKFTLYSEEEMSVLNKEWLPLCENLLKQEFTRNITDINNYLASSRNLTVSYYEERKSWLHILEQLLKSDIDEEAIKETISLEIYKLRHAHAIYRQKLQKLLNTLSLNDTFNLPYYKNMQTTHEMNKIGNVFIVHDLMRNLDGINLYLHKEALKPKKSFLGFFNSAPNYHSERSSWIHILSEFQKAKKNSKLILLDILSAEINRFSNNVWYAFYLAGIQESLKDFTTLDYFPYDSVKMMFELHNLQTVAEVGEQFGVCLDHATLNEYKQLLDKYPRSGYFLSCEELFLSRKINKLRSPAEYQLKALYRIGKNLYLKAYHDYHSGSDNYEQSHEIFQALVKQGYKKAYAMLCNYAYMNSFTSRDKSYQDIINYCKIAPTECGPNGNFFAFVACIKLRKNFKESMQHLKQSALLGSFNAWIVMQCILFKKEAHLFTDTETNHIEISTVLGPESRRLAAEAIESLLLNNQVPIQKTDKVIRTQVSGFDPKNVKDKIALLKALSNLYKNGSPDDDIAINIQKAAKLENLVHDVEELEQQSLKL